MGEEPPSKRMKISSDIDALMEERASLVDVMDESDATYIRELLVHAFSLPFCVHRDNYYDRLALFDCALEIVASRADRAKPAICMAHTIQNSLSNHEIRCGWRVSFSTVDGSHRFFYLSDRLREKRIIAFRYKPSHA